MKTLLLTLCILLILPWGVRAQDQQEGTIAGELMGSGWFEDNWAGDTWGGGIKLGLLTRLDKDKGIWLRTTYGRLDFGPGNPIHSIDICLLVDWYLGVNWDIYLTTGAENYVDGGLAGTDLMGGLGLARTIWTGEAPDWTIPARCKLFGEMVFVDAGEQVTGNFMQLNVGLRFHKPEK